MSAVGTEDFGIMVEVLLSLFPSTNDVLFNTLKSKSLFGHIPAPSHKQ